MKLMVGRFGLRIILMAKVPPFRLVYLYFEIFVISIAAV
jgi:hypothetical protein